MSVITTGLLVRVHVGIPTHLCTVAEATVKTRLLEARYAHAERQPPVVVLPISTVAEASTLAPTFRNARRAPPLDRADRVLSHAANGKEVRRC
jgi:hypothetical protein